MQTLDSPNDIPMRVPEHGRGQLRTGGNNPGSGRPSSAVRQSSRDNYDRGSGFISKLLDLVEAKFDAATSLEDLGELRAMLGELLRGIDISGKYGLGEAKTIIPEEVIEALGQVLGNPDHKIPIESIPGIVNELTGLLKG